MGRDGYESWLPAYLPALVNEQFWGHESSDKTALMTQFYHTFLLRRRMCTLCRSFIVCDKMNQIMRKVVIGFGVRVRSCIVLLRVAFYHYV